MKRPCEEWSDACVDAAEDHINAPFASHLEKCDACREAVERLRDDLELLKPDPSPVPGPWLAKSIRHKAEAERERRPSRLLLLAPAAAAAAVLVILALIASWTAETVDSPVIAEAPSDSTPFPGHDILQPGEDSTLVLNDIWEEDWGPGVYGLLAGADDDDLIRILENIPP